MANATGSDVVDDGDDDVAVTFSYVDYTQAAVVRYAFVVAYVIVASVSFAGNLLVMVTVYGNKRMHSPTNYYIFNLAVSEFLVAAVVMPLKLVEYAAPADWNVFRSDLLCSSLYFILPVFVFESVLTLVAITLERFAAIFVR